MKNVNDLVWEGIYTGKNAEPWVMTCYDLVTPGSGWVRVAISENQVMGMIAYNPYTVPQNMVLVIQNLKVGSEPSGNRFVMFGIRSTTPNFADKPVLFFEKYADTLVYDIKNGLWHREGTIVEIVVNNKDTIDLYPFVQVSGILVNVSEAFKRRKE